MTARLTEAELDEIITKGSIPYTDKPFWKTISSMAIELLSARAEIARMRELIDSLPPEPVTDDPDPFI